MKKMHTSLFLAVHALLLAVLPAIVHAQTGNINAPSSSFKNPIGYDSLEAFLKALLEVVIAVAFPIVVFMIIYTGFLFVSARGNKEKLETAKKALVWTLIGAMIVLGAFVLANAISETVEDIQNAQKVAPALTYHDY